MDEQRKQVYDCICTSLMLVKLPYESMEYALTPSEVNTLSNIIGHTQMLIDLLKENSEHLEHSPEDIMKL